MCSVLGRLQKTIYVKSPKPQILLYRANTDHVLLGTVCKRL